MSQWKIFLNLKQLVFGWRQRVKCGEIIFLITIEFILELFEWNEIHWPREFVRRFDSDDLL